MASEYLRSYYRTHTCAELTEAEVGREVSLSGWVLRKRDHGGVVFIDLRDHYGVTQVVIDGALRERAQDTRTESVLRVRGEVVRRTPEMVNPKLPTGQIEVRAQEVEVLSEAEVLPFLIAEEDNAPEAIRLKWRFLELRREELHRNIMLRNEVVRAMREIMHDLGFAEFSTPILTSSSPEGARDFIVPSRLHPGKFYALPQAPQQFKQLLMISGFDRYFQIAPCFRDEDSRADRSPGEFYQLDMELSFVEQDDVLRVNEQLLDRLFGRFSNFARTGLPYPRIRYNDCLNSYGTDKPDLRIPLKIDDVSEHFKESQFRVFRGALDSGGAIFAIKTEVTQVPPRKFFDDLIEQFKQTSGQGLAYLIFQGEEVKGSVGKFFSAAEIEALRATLQIKQLTVVFFAAGPKKLLLPHLGRLRVKLGQDLGLLEKDAWRFCWVTDFPMYEEDEATKQIGFSHNPFSMPQGGLEALKTKNPLEVYAYQYDLVLNGNELASGAIRNHKPETMYKAFEIAGYSKETVDEKFGGMIRAFQYGAPPHGGIAFGVERISMLLADELAIREVIAFPLAQNGEDLMMGAPSTVTAKQLNEVHIALKLPEKK